MGNQGSSLDKRDKSSKTILASRSKSEENLGGEPQSQTLPSLVLDSEGNSKPQLSKKSSQNQNRPLTPTSQQGGRSGSGLDLLASDLKRGQPNRKLSSAEIKNINKTLRFISIHRSVKQERESHKDTIKLTGGPLLGFDLPTISETFPLNGDVVAGRMSFSNNLNDFSQKYKFRVETYNSVAESVKLDSLKQDPRLQGNKSKALSELANTNARNSNRFFNITPSKEREFSPEFVFSHNTGDSAQNQEELALIRRQIRQPPPPLIEEAPVVHERRVTDYGDIQGAITRIKQKEANNSDFNLSIPIEKSPTRVASLPDVNKPSLVNTKNSSRAQKVSVSPKNNSFSNTRSKSPVFIVKKPEEIKSSTPRIAGTKSPAKEKTPKSTFVTSSAKPKVPNNSKSPSVSSHSEHTPVVVDLRTKKNTSKPTSDNAKSRSPIRQTQEDLMILQPQSTRVQHKKFWKEAERPTTSPSNKKQSHSQSKINDISKHEDQNRINSITSLSKKMQPEKHQNVRTEPSPMVSEYIKYRYAHQSQDQFDPNIPVKVFNLTAHTPSTSHLSVNAAGIENLNYTNAAVGNNSRSALDKEDSLKHYSQERFIKMPQKVEYESKDLGDSSNDDIEPIEATLDLSAYIANSGTNLDQDYAQSSREAREKEFLTLQVSGQERLGPNNLQYKWENDPRNKRNTEPEIDTRMNWDVDPIHAKKNYSIDIKPKYENSGHNYIEERESRDSNYEEERENGDFGDNYYEEDKNEDKFLREIKERLAKVSGKTDTLPGKTSAGLPKGERSGRMDQIEMPQKGAVRRYNQDTAYDIDVKENDSYASNLQKDEKVLNHGGKILRNKLDEDAGSYANSEKQ